MIRALLLCVALFQASSPSAQKPIIENDRVAVFDVTDSAAAQPTDAVVVSLHGNAAFLPKGTAPAQMLRNRSQRNAFAAAGDHTSCGRSADWMALVEGVAGSPRWKSQSGARPSEARAQRRDCRQLA